MFVSLFVTYELYGYFKTFLNSFFKGSFFLSFNNLVLYTAYFKTICYTK